MNQEHVTNDYRDEQHAWKKNTLLQTIWQFYEYEHKAIKKLSYLVYLRLDWGSKSLQILKPFMSVSRTNQLG